MTYRILVTGGAGFIGSHIADAFVAAGQTVAVLDNLSTGARANVPAEASFYWGDIRDARVVQAVFRAFRPDVVCHQAALADVRASLADPAGYTQTNVIGTLNLLEAGRAAGTVKKFLFASTGGAVYGEPEQLPATESCPARPLDPYGASKLACEHYIDTYRHNYGLETCILRYANVYGPRQDVHGEAGVVAICAGAMLENRLIVINGDGRQTRDFVYVGDVARANLAGLALGHGIYNVGTGVPTDVNTICAELIRLTGYRGEPSHGPPKPGEVRHTYLDCTRARRDLAWGPVVSLRDGLAKTVEALRLRIED